MVWARMAADGPDDRSVKVSSEGYGSTPGVINTSIAIYQSISKVLLVDRMTVRFNSVCLFPSLGCYVFGLSFKRPEMRLS